MSRRILHLVAEILWFCILSGLAFAQLQQPLPKLNYDMTADFFQLPPGEHLIEPAGVAVNSKGHIYVFHRGKHPLMEFDSSGKFLRSIADDLFVTAHMVRVEPRGQHLDHRCRFACSSEAIGSASPIPVAAKVPASAAPHCAQVCHGLRSHVRGKVRRFNTATKCFGAG